MSIITILLSLLSLYWERDYWVSYDLQPRRQAFKAQIAQLKERVQ